MELDQVSSKFFLSVCRVLYRIESRVIVTYTYIFQFQHVQNP